MLKMKNTKFIDMFSKISMILVFTFTIGIFFSCAPQKTGDSKETADSSTVNSYGLKPDESIGYTVSMGVMPDLNFEGEGMLIGHVNKDRPGEKAGLLKGDILLEMDSTRITNLVSYTRALSNYKAGDEARIIIKRDDQLMEMKVSFE